MKVIIFGATGMVGQGVLRECLLDSEVESVLSIVRTPSGQKHSKLQELVHQDFYNYATIETKLKGYDACFFCLGVSSAGMKEEDYLRVTYDLTLAAASIIATQNSGMTFIYVSGQGTDGSEQGSSMWARVKGKTENALIKLPIKAVYMFRPGFIQPMHGIKSKTKLYRLVYAVASPLYPLLKAVGSKFVTSTEQVGRAMLQVAKYGAKKRFLENGDINELAAGGQFRDAVQH